jgi:hypothetical protein
MLEPRQLHATGASPRRTSTKGTLSLHRDCRGSCSLLQRGPRCDSQAAAVKQAERAAGFTSSVHCLRWSPVAPALFCVSVSAHAATEQHQLSLFGFLLRRRPSPEPLTSRAQQQQQPAAVCHLISRAVRRDGQLGANEAVVRNARAPTSSTSTHGTSIDDGIGLSTAPSRPVVCRPVFVLTRRDPLCICERVCIRGLPSLFVLRGCCRCCTTYSPWDAPQPC